MNIATSNRTPNQQRALDMIRLRKQSYANVFKTEDARFSRIVLEDLARFCRAERSAYDPDPRTHALLEGRREVWLRIADHLGLSDSELYEKFVGGK